MLLEILTIATNTAVLSLVGYVVFNLFKVKNKLYPFFEMYKMNAEELLSEQIVENINIDDDKQASEVNGSLQEKKRERLSSVVAGGSSKQYLGKELQLSDIDKMTTEQINKLYCKYEARLGASMTKTLGNSFINLYVMGVSKFFKVVNPPILIQDLEEDPFINNALTNTCCELYYRYGMYLAPFTAMLTTARHIEPLASLDFRKKDENNDIKNDE